MKQKIKQVRGNPLQSLHVFFQESLNTGQKCFWTTPVVGDEEYHSYGAKSFGDPGAQNHMKIINRKALRLKAVWMVN